MVRASVVEVLFIGMAQGMKDACQDFNATHPDERVDISEVFSAHFTFMKRALQIGLSRGISRDTLQKGMGEAYSPIADKVVNG